MSKQINAIKGMNDILPPESARWEWLEEVVRRVMAAHVYRNVRTPIMELTQLYRAACKDQSIMDKFGHGTPADSP